MEDGEVWSARRQRQAVPIRRTPCTPSSAHGRKFEEKEVQKDIDLMPYKIAKADNGDAWVEIRGKKMRPRKSSAQVLRKMRRRRGLSRRGMHRSSHHRPGLLQRFATAGDKDAGGSRPRVKRIINEPTARRSRSPGQEGRPQDRVTTSRRHLRHPIIEIRRSEGEHQFEVLSTNGDTFLGGEDFDQAPHRLSLRRVQEEQG